MPVTISEIFSNQWIALVLGLLLAFSLTWFIIPSIVHTSRLKNLGAVSNGRTSHKDTLPNLGGIAVFIGFVVSAVFFTGTFLEFELQYIICGLTIVLFLGIKDDILIIDPWKKLIGQIMAAGIIVVFSDIRIDNLYGLFGINEIPYIVSLVFTVFVFLVIINGFNLIDGIDGLASGVGILTSSVFGIWFLLAGDIAFAILSFSFTGSLLAFFYFNVFSKKNKIILGDTGSHVTGFVVGILTFRFMQHNSGINGSAFIYSAPAVAIGILIIPLFDTLRVFSLRIMQGKSPFKADRQHIHHCLLEFGFTHLQATFILLIVNMFFITLCYLLQGIGILQLTLVILGLAILMSYTLAFFKKKKLKLAAFSEYAFEGTWNRQIITKSAKRIKTRNDDSDIGYTENQIETKIVIDPGKVINPKESTEYQKVTDPGKVHVS